MTTSIDENLFDQRVVTRYIRSGLVSKDDYQAHLDSLEDCAELAEDCETQFSYHLPAGEDEDADSAS